jgi:transcriptional regulator with PAS, ATPase and Fis domain/tetratricopeptide (TPR) repeat protein
MPRHARHAARSEDRDALVRAVEIALDRGDYADAATMGARAVAASDGSPEGNTRSSSRRLYALALLYSNRNEEAHRFAREAARISRGARALTEQALAELVLSEIARARGDYLVALSHAARARPLAARAHDIPTLRSVLAEYGLNLSAVGDGERAREAFDEALALPAAGQPPSRAFRVLHDAARMHRTAGRFDDSQRLLDRAEALATSTDLVAAGWSICVARVSMLVDLGAVDDAEKYLAAHKIAPDASPSQRADVFMLRAMIAHASGKRPELVERYAAQGLALEPIDPLSRLALERLRATGLFGRGLIDDAERIAVAMVSVAAKGGALALAAPSMALAARCGRPEAALLRWLGAFALSTSGVAARVEHESLAALASEPDPIGTLARIAVDVARSRMVDRAPAAHRNTLLRALRQVESKALHARQMRRAESETTLDEAAMRAKEAVGIAGQSPPLVRALATLARASKSDASIVVMGETGSGKELFARLAHRLSKRAGGPFVAINCAAIPEQLLEAELFGHERGAFTGADRARSGLFVEAQGGTLFLDEVGEMSAAMQAKLLRVLEEREVRAIGGGRARKVDVRVLAATHRDLQALVVARAFREDLFYRLAAITVRVPSLRERPEDVPVIAKAILARDPTLAHFRLDVPALTVLAENAWPGNVREMANVLRAAAAIAEGNAIGREELAQALAQGSPRIARTDGSRDLNEATLLELRVRHRAELRELVGRAIASADGNKLRAARALGISRQGLYRVLAEFDE